MIRRLDPLREITRAWEMDWAP